jgi:hypothetical protein
MLGAHKDGFFQPEALKGQGAILGESIGSFTIP